MSKDYDDLEAKIKAAREEVDEMPLDKPDNRGMRAGSEFLAAVIGFTALGFGIDKYFNTTPWGMIILSILGFVGGVYTASKTMKENE